MILKINMMSMGKIIHLSNKLFTASKKAKKFLPFFIGFKLLTFTGFLTYIMNRQIILNLSKTSFLLSFKDLVNFLNSFWPIYLLLFCYAALKNAIN